MRRFRTLKIKIILPILFILIMIFFTSSYLIIDREYNAARTSLVDNAESYASLSVEKLVKNYQGLYEFAFHDYFQIVDNLLSLNKDVKTIQVVNVNGKILFDSNEIENGKYYEIIHGERLLENNEFCDNKIF